MKNFSCLRNKLTSTLSGLAVAALLNSGLSARATNYVGNGNTGFGGSIGNGTLSVTDDGTNLTFKLLPSGGSIGGGNGVALFIDTGAAGFTSTAGFQDAFDGGHSVVSGYSGSGQSVMTFTNGFQPAYAISFGDSFTSLYKLANGGNGSFTYITGTGTGPLTFTIPAADIGLTPGTPATIRIFGSLVSGSGYRSTEAIAGNDFGLQGWNPFSQTAYSVYSFATPPAPTYNVTFQVDMTEQIATGAFNPTNGDAVYVGGTFETNAWSNVQLLPSVSNTNIYVGTYSDQNPTNTVEQFKFNFYSVSGASNSWEFNGALNRNFALAGNETLPVVYFNDVYPTPSATTNNLTVSIDMGPQIYLGDFDPNTMQIEAFGTFSSPPWSSGFVLTNNPTATNSNVYSGTTADGNYPGSFEQFKFVIVNGSTNTYENGNNRYFYTPTNSGALPLAYFNNVSTYGATPITFQVDMTVPLAAGAFVPGNGDTVSPAGTFQTNVWTPAAFPLSPSANNPHVYVGTYVDKNQPGVYEQFKYVVVNGAQTITNYESVNNRVFLLGSTAYTNPVVFWNNLNPNQVLLMPTTVTFAVDMANAVDIFSNAFNPASDSVIINGDFLNPAWPNVWLDPYAYYPGVQEDYPQLVLQVSADGHTYTNMFLIPAGQSHEVTYKYGIIHNSGGQVNTNCDNEAGFAQNHVRYIRATGTYNFPTDVFGQQRTNSAAATELLYGVSIGRISGGSIPVSWLGFAGITLQTSTNLSGGWQNVPGADAAGTTNWPATNGQQFFRYPNPQP